MRVHTAVLAGVLAALCAAGCGKNGGQDQSAKPGSRLTIAVIPKGSTHEFWKAIHAGALDASKEEQVDIIWKGPIKEDDREEQIQTVESFIAAKVDAIVLAPLDDRALLPCVREAKLTGIPTVIVDSDLVGNDHIAFIATDNYRGGVIGAELAGKLVSGSGRLIMVRCMEGAASSTAREEGFITTIRSKFPGITVLSDNQYAGATTESAYRTCENLLNRFGDVEVIFTPNESSTFGCLRALQDYGLAGKVFFVGFDSSEKLIQALRDGEINGLVVQNPYKMGYDGVKTAAAYLRHKPFQQHIDTGVYLVTRENMDDPDMVRLIRPAIE
ncbi:substrate-binding domain-containing protein [bacterium]|nr:substrate-binding domain-containing protein [bacterium]